MNKILLPFEQWPEIDRQLWDQAKSDADFLGKPGAAAHWSPATLVTRIKAYGAWLAYLATEGQLDWEMSPSKRLSDDCVREYYQVLIARNAAVTVLGRLEDLRTMINALEGSANLPFLQRLIDRHKRKARPVRDKHGSMINPVTALRDVYRYLEEEQQATFNASRKQLVDWRTALMVAILINLPIRRANLAALMIGTHMIKRGDHYDIALSRTETKTRRPYNGPLPPALTIFMDHYLEVVRPRLFGSTHSACLWASYRYGSVSPHTLSLSVRAFTLKLYGIALPPHQFRDIVTTFHAVHDPAHFHGASAILGHTDLKTTQEHYNQSQMLDAVRQFQSFG